jgi:hypothetical protein
VATGRTPLLYSRGVNNPPLGGAELLSPGGAPPLLFWIWLAVGVLVVVRAWSAPPAPPWADD